MSPSPLTVSWMRAYHVGSDRSGLSAVRGERLPALGLEPVDLDDEGVYDVQTLVRGHVTQGRTRPIGLRTKPPGAAGELVAEVQASLLFHVSGFVVLRFTVGGPGMDVLDSPDALRWLHRRLWSADPDVAWTLAGEAEQAGALRWAMNRVVLDVLARMQGRPAAPEQLAAWAHEGPGGCQYLHELHARGAVDFPYPVIWGTHYELLDGHDDAETDAWAARLLGDGSSGAGAVPHDLEQDGSPLRWYISEMQSAVVLPGGERRSGSDVLEPRRVRLCEFFALRRAALRCVQRDTQLVLAERRTVPRGQVDAWRRIVSTTCDDYVLHDDMGPLLKPLEERLRADERIRDLHRLQEQVARNIDSFQSQLDVAGERAGTVLGVLFGVVAALALSAVLKQLLAIVLGVVPATADGFAGAHPRGSVAVDAATVALLGAGALVGFRYVSGRLPGRRASGSRVAAPPH